MLTHRGFAAWIVSEGKELPELEVVVDNMANKVSCWIPCEVGKTFSVHWQDHGSGVDSAAYINLDGFTVPGRFLYGLGAAQRDSIRVGDNSERQFQFACVDTARTGEGRASTADVGVITLKIKQIKRTSPDHPANKPLKPPGTAHIRRGGSEVCIGFGLERTASMQLEKTWAFVPYDNSCPGTYVQFVFRYRTRDFLLQQGIISCSDIAEQPMFEDRVPSNEERSYQVAIGPLQHPSALQPTFTVHKFQAQLGQQMTPSSASCAGISPALLTKQSQDSSSTDASPSSTLVSTPDFSCLLLEPTSQHRGPFDFDTNVTFQKGRQWLSTPDESIQPRLSQGFEQYEFEPHRMLED